MSSNTIDDAAGICCSDAPTLAGRIASQVRLVCEALMDAFAAHGAYLELTSRGVEPREAAQIVVSSHFLQRG